MVVDIAKKSWLGDLVDAALERYDPATALVRLPPELRGTDPDGPGLEARARALLLRSLRRNATREPAVHRGAEGGAPAPPAHQEDVFLAPIHGHVELALDVALVHGAPFDPARRRAELAMLLAAMTGALDHARAADPARPGGATPPALRKALARAGAALKARGHPPGDPRDGLPLRAGLLCIERRKLARLAIGYYRDGHLDLAAARKVNAIAVEDTLLLVEALSALAAASGRPSVRRRRASLAQVARLDLAREDARRARAGVKAPRPLPELARAAPVRLRAFLLQQLLVSELAAAHPSAARAEAVQAFAEEARIPAVQRAALQADAAQLHADQQRWLEPGPSGQPDEWEFVAEEWEEVADEMMKRVAAAVTDNLEAIVTEIKKTGELGQLLGKAAAGHPLSEEDRRKVKSQLVDLAKAVPALAIFAAPGGMLLLPLLAKVLPFSVLPSAWDAKRLPPRAKKP